MAWGKELTKEDLIKAGLDPADLAELKANGVKKADLETMKTELTTSIMDQIKNQFTELETKLQPKPIVNNENNNNNEEVVDEQMEYATDPVKFLNKKVGQSVGFAAVQNTKIRMDLALDRARSSMKGFRNDALKKEIMTEWQTYKPEMFAMNKDFDPDALLTKVHDMVIGRHHEEIQRDTDKREGVFNMVASGNSGGGNNNSHTDDRNNKKPEDMLTDVELDMAKKYGMTPKEWADSAAALEDETKVVKAGA